jgi:prepilin-type N-terminal cleavage/methylation domain-containing protein
MPRSPAFTLIELLVVVTIIVVLLALLTPALDRAINRAEDVKCMSNLHAVGRALTYYLQDHKRTFPRVSHFSQLFGDKPRNPDGSEAGGSRAPVVVGAMWTTVHSISIWAIKAPGRESPSPSVPAIRATCGEIRPTTATHSTGPATSR